MKRIIALLLAIFILILPMTAFSAGAGPVKLNTGAFSFDYSSAYYTPDGDGRASAYELWEFDSKSAAKKGDTENAVLLYRGKLKKYCFKSLPDDMRYYAVRSFSVIRDKKYYSPFTYSGQLKKTQISGFKLASTSLTLNIGSKRTLKCFFDIDRADSVYFPVEGFFSSNSKIVSVNKQTGELSAKAAGSCVLTCKVTGGYSKTCKVTVNKTPNMKGSLYFTYDHIFPDGGVNSLPDQIKGSTNRINGTVICDDPIDKLSVTIKNSKGKAEASYSYRPSGAKSVDLADISSNIPFRELKKGKKTLYVTVYTSRGKQTVYKKSFNVTGTPKTQSAKAQAVLSYAYTRLSDPYSQPLRSYKCYLDCSYLAYWCFKEGAGITLPNVAAYQYKWCVENGKLITKDELQPGDLVFYTVSGNGRYGGVNHVAIYAGDGYTIEADAPAVRYGLVPVGARQLAYARPY